MVETVLLVARSVFKLQRVILMRHLELDEQVPALGRRCSSWLRVLDGVLRRLVLGQPVRDGARPPQPAHGSVLVGLGLDDELQHPRPPDLLVQEHAHEHPRDVRGLDPHQHRSVVRALRHHRALAEPRLLAELVGLLPPDVQRRGRLRRDPRGLLLHGLPPLHALAADGRRWPRSRERCRRPTRTTAHGGEKHEEAHDPDHVPDAAVAGGLVPGGAE